MASACLQHNNNNTAVPNTRVTIRSSSSLKPNNSSKKISVSCSKHLLLKSLKISALQKPQAVVVTKDSWERSILKSELPVLVEFYASWCGPCRMVDRIIDEIAAEYAGKLTCFVLNTDNDPHIANDYDIKAVPVVVLFKNGAQCESIAGTMPKDFYVAAIERILES